MRAHACASEYVHVCDLLKKARQVWQLPLMKLRSTFVLSDMVFPKVSALPAALKFFVIIVLLVGYFKRGSRPLMFLDYSHTSSLY